MAANAFTGTCDQSNRAQARSHSSLSKTHQRPLP